MWVVSVCLICMTCLPGIVSVENRGKLFITAFPENVAFYDPVPHNHILFVTAVKDNTEVTVSVDSVVKWNKVLPAAVTETVTLESSIELERSQFSQKAVVINSTKDISVVAESKRYDTVQLLMLQPVNSLGTDYYIPILSANQGDGSLPGFADFHDARGKIVIINSEKDNKVKMHFSEGYSEQQMLQPFSVFQLNISDSLPVSIIAEHNVVMLLTHPCSNTTPCTCQMVVTQLQPTNTWGTTFLIPSAFRNTNNIKTHLFVTSDQTATSNSASQLVNGIISPNSGSFLVSHLTAEYLSSSKNFSVMLIQPGHIIELIPLSGFSACYLLPKTPSSTKALVVVLTSKTSQVRLGKVTGINWNWQTIDSQPYSWAEINFSSAEYNVIWHPSTKIGVYIYNGKEWSQALSLATEPASQGCLVDVKHYSVINQSGTWAEAINHCQQNNGKLVSINNEEILQELSKSLSNPSKEKEVWVGLRRRLFNGEWYWLNKLSMNITKWASEEQGSSQEKLCASMSLSSSDKDNFLWKSKSCCRSLKPVCYYNDIYFPLPDDA